MTKKHLIAASVCILACAAAGLAIVGCTGDGQLISGTEFGALVRDTTLAVGGDEKTANTLGGATGKTWQGVRGFDIKEEIGIGQGVALQAFTQFGPLSTDQQLLRYVNLVGLSCAEACDRPALPYRFAVIKNDDVVNAFAAPGGYVFVTTGALVLMKNEAELAGVLAHEIGHVVEKHSLGAARAGKILEAAGELASEGDAAQQQFNQLSDFLINLLFERGLSKPAEHKADTLGVEYAYNAGYDPRGLRNFLVTLKAKQGSRQTGWFKTHPDTAARVAKIDSQIRRDMPDAKGFAVLEARFRTNCLARLR